MKKAVFIYNPRSGKAQMESHLATVIHSFNQNGYKVLMYATQYPKQAQEIVEEEGNDSDLIVCSGGDGTLNEVINGMMNLKKQPPLGYIPAGSTNDFAISLGLPKDVKEGMEVALKGNPFVCDVGKFNDRHFIYVAAFGAFTAVTYMTSQQTKNMLGYQAYLLEGVKQLSSIKPIHMKVLYDNTEIEGDFLYGMVSNSTSVGGMKCLTGKDVNLQDGKFEVLLIKNPKQLSDFNSVVASLIAKCPEGELFYSFKASKVQFFSNNPVSWVLDGEFGGDVCEVVIENNPFAVQIMTHSEKKYEKT